MRILLSVLISAALAATALAQSAPTGLWKTVDDKTGKARSLVRIYEQNGKLFGKIEKSLNPNGLKTCDKCTDERKGQPIAGLVIIRNLSKHGNEYSGGDVVDPDTGSVYKCKIWTTDGGKKLVVRGFLGFSLIGRSQTWDREPE